MCCCFLPQMFSFIFNGQKSQACLTPPTDSPVQYLENPKLASKSSVSTEIQMLTSQTNKKVSQHRPVEFDTGPSISYRNKTKQNTKYYFLWTVCVFKVKGHPSSLTQSTDVTEHTKMFLINTRFCHVIVSELTAYFPVLLSFIF